MAQVSSLSSKNLFREFWQAVNKGVIKTNLKKRFLYGFIMVETFQLLRGCSHKGEGSANLRVKKNSIKCMRGFYRVSD